MNQEKIIVAVDGKEKRLFRGLRVRDAIGARSTRAVEQRRALIRDAAGNRVDIDGALHDGQRLFVVRLPQTRTGNRA